MRTLCLYLYDGDNKNNLKRQKNKNILRNLDIFFIFYSMF